MLKKRREDVLYELQNKLEYDLNNIFTDSYHYPVGDQFTPDYSSGEAIHGPSQCYGWPPGITSLIKRVALATAVTIVDAVYTEKELEDKVEHALLDTDDANLLQ